MRSVRFVCFRRLTQQVPHSMRTACDHIFSQIQPLRVDAWCSHITYMFKLIHIKISVMILHIHSYIYNYYTYCTLICQLQEKEWNRLLFKLTTKLKRLRPFLEGFVVTMHKGACEHEVKSRGRYASVFNFTSWIIVFSNKNTNTCSKREPFHVLWYRLV